MDHSTDHQAKIIHLIHHKILEQITQAAITQATMTYTTELGQQQKHRSPATNKVRTEKSELPKQV